MKLFNSKSILVAAIAGMFALISCDGGLKTTLEGQTLEIEFMIDTTSKVGNIVFANAAKSNNLDSALEAQGLDYRSTDIESLTLTDLAVEIVAPISDVTNFNLIDTINASMSTATLPSVTIADLSVIPQNTDSMNFQLQATDIKDYAISPMLNFNLSGHTNAAITDTVNIKTTLTYTIVISE